MEGEIPGGFDGTGDRDSSWEEKVKKMERENKVENSQKILAEIQELFKVDKGWESEESMIEDMAETRRAAVKIEDQSRKRN